MVIFVDLRCSEYPWVGTKVKNHKTRVFCFEIMAQIPHLSFSRPRWAHTCASTCAHSNLERPAAHVTPSSFIIIVVRVLAQSPCVGQERVLMLLCRAPVPHHALIAGTHLASIAKMTSRSIVMACYNPPSPVLRPHSPPPPGCGYPVLAATAARAAAGFPRSGAMPSPRLTWPIASWPPGRRPPPPPAASRPPWPSAPSRRWP